MTSWENSKDKEFLDYYRAESSLWNPRDIYYKSVAKRNEAWARIAKCMGASVKDVKRKKESLLSTYRKIRRGLTGDEVVKPSWCAYEYIDEFLGDVNYNRSLWSASDTEPHEPHEPREPQAVKRKAETQEDIDDNEGETYFYVPPPEAERQRGDPLQTEALTYVRQAVQLLGLALKGQTEEDDCDLYCKILGARLRKLPEMERYETMHQIDGLLLKRRRASSPENNQVYLEEYAPDS